MLSMQGDRIKTSPLLYQAAIFDFDGTLSLLRRGWQQVMIPMAVEYLAAAPTQETSAELHGVAESFVTRLTGKQTIYQMIQLAREVEKRGGVPREPLEYKRDYHDRLWRIAGKRIDAVKKGEVSAEEMTVPGSEPLLQELVSHGVICYLASGTDENYVKDETALLQLDGYFEDRIYGALDDYKKFSKAMVIQRIIEQTSVPGEAIVGFGDGYVEIEEVKKVGGLAIGVACDEFTREGVDPWKQQRLIEAGADRIVADYRDLADVLKPLKLAPNR